MKPGSGGRKKKRKKKYPHDLSFRIKAYVLQTNDEYCNFSFHTFELTVQQRQEPLQNVISPRPNFKTVKMKVQNWHRNKWNRNEYDNI